jgi:cytochrome c6
MKFFFIYLCFFLFSRVENLLETSSAFSVVYISDSLKSSSKESFFEGKILFFKYCNLCHENKQNVIIPEKNLKEETLKTNSMYNINSISYQIINGKNGMPAFGGKLNEKEIKQIASYILSSFI